MHKGNNVIEFKQERREFIVHTPTYTAKAKSKKLVLSPDLKQLAEASIMKNLREEDEKSKRFLANK